MSMQTWHSRAQQETSDTRLIRNMHSNKSRVNALECTVCYELINKAYVAVTFTVLQNDMSFFNLNQIESIILFVRTTQAYVKKSAIVCCYASTATTTTTNTNCYLSNLPL